MMGTEIVSSNKKKKKSPLDSAYKITQFAKAEIHTFVYYELLRKRLGRLLTSCHIHSSRTWHLAHRQVSS